MSSPTSTDQLIKGFNNQQIGAFKEIFMNMMAEERKEAEDRMMLRIVDINNNNNNRFNNLHDVLTNFIQKETAKHNINAKAEPPDPNPHKYTMSSTGGSITTVPNTELYESNIKSNTYHSLSNHNGVDNMNGENDNEDKKSMPSSARVHTPSSYNVIPNSNMNNMGSLYSSSSMPVNNSPVFSSSHNVSPNNHSNNNYNQNNNGQDRPKPPIDTNQKFPSGITELPYGEVSPELYTEWANKVLLSIKGLTKYQGIIDQEPQDSWEVFKKRNSKYSPEQLEIHYLDAHRAAWAFLCRGINQAFGVRLEEKIKQAAQGMRLPDVLNFASTDSTFYENSHELWKLIKSYYMVATGFRVSEIMSDLEKLSYNGAYDPKTFIASYLALHDKGKLLCPEFPVYSDNMMAVHILSKMPSSSIFENMRSRFYNQDSSSSIQLSVKNVESFLRDWWVNNSGKFKLTGEKSQFKPIMMDRNLRRGRSRESYNTNNRSMSRERVVSANPTYPSSTKSNQHDRSRSQSRDRRDFSRSQSRDSGRNHSQGKVNKTLPDVEGEGDEVYSCPTLVEYEDTGEKSDTESFIGSAIQDGNKNYIPSVEEIILDSGSAAMITPRVEELVNIQPSSKMIIQTISGKSHSESEGTLKIGRLIFKHMKIVKNAPFTILSVGQICNGKQLVAVCTERAAYLVPKAVIEESTLIKKAVMTFPKRGNLYVKTPTFFKGDRQEVKLLTREEMVKLRPASGPSYDASNVRPQIPSKGKPTLSAIKAATDLIKGKTSVSVPPSVSQPVVSNPVVTRKGKTRSNSPYSRRDVQFYDGDDPKQEEHMDNLENYKFNVNRDGSSDSDEY